MSKWLCQGIGAFCVQLVHTHHLLQELGYMARRGHKSGIISTYEYTWLLETDGSGLVRVSDAIHCARQGDGSCASVAEVDKLSLELWLWFQAPSTVFSVSIPRM